MPRQKLRIAVAGLGRMGKRHAINFHVHTYDAQVVAVTSPVESEREWARQNIDGVSVYDDYESMLSDPRIEAVVVATVTAVHAEQTLAAIAKGYHVLCEKPLSLDFNIAQSVLDAYNNSLQVHPSQKVMCGFSRRFDASYREAHEKMTSGDWGNPVIFRSQTADLYDSSGFFLDYAKTSGGIFKDCSIHDIDLLLWFFVEKTNIKSLQAIGTNALHLGLSESNDRDNAVATLGLQGGKIATLYCTRIMAAGQEDTTEIICQKGSIRINMQGRKNHLEIHDAHGSRCELPQHYYERFKDAFITEASEFTACCLHDQPLPIELESSVRAIAIAHSLQQSLISGEKLVFAEDSRL
ncbi:myo-inositol 2-dehydrogenase [Colletotrichum fioriniae PJ7]|uniref:Myo-inositol 2-dehydrogenase n=1 Tax=Colletotrichum fioriniae PJ7 TaxID=1445577 RepID=A0A010RSE0_9PEZI|nr:myo-inositol 2-dehydrogenase [Colletotrichum fioriniae PJ7]